MPEDQDLEVLRAVVTASSDQQAREHTHDEGEEEEHREMVGEPLVRVRIEVLDPVGSFSQILDLTCVVTGWTAMPAVPTRAQ